MLEGLEISEVSFSKAINVLNESRWDSEYYLKLYVNNQEYLNSLSTERLFDKCEFIKKGIFDLPPSNYQESGIPLIRTSEIKNPIVDFNTTVYLSEQTNKDNYKTILNPNDLVFTKIGAYIGDVSILPSTHQQYNFSQNVAGCKLIDTNEGAFILSFFLSKIGKSQILRSIMLSGQGKLELNDIRNYLIPKLSSEFKMSIKDIIDKVYDFKKQSKQTYTQAENLLLDEIGLKDFKPSNEAVNIKSFKESFQSSGRLDAEYYQPKYEQFENVIKLNKKGLTLVKNEFNHIKKTSKKDKAGYNYIEIGNINVGDGLSSSNYIEAQELPANAKILAKKGDLLISKVRPYRGAVSVIDFDKEDLIVSGAFTVLREKQESDFSSEVLKVLFRTNIYKEWLLKFNVGTQYPVIKDDDILNLPIPIIDKLTQQNITSKIQESQTLKAKSEKLLEVAKQAVEKAIEQDEQTALDYIKVNSDL